MESESPRSGAAGFQGWLGEPRGDCWASLPFYLNLHLHLNLQSSGCGFGEEGFKFKFMGKFKRNG